MMFSVPVLVRTTHDYNIFYDMYVELDIEAETLEEATRIAHSPKPASGGPVEKHPTLMSIVEIKPWDPDSLPRKEVVLE